MHDVHVESGIALLNPRWAISHLRGPMTRMELQQARRAHALIIGRPFRMSAVEGAKSLGVEKEVQSPLAGLN